MEKKLAKFFIPATALLAVSCLSSCGEKPFTGKVFLDYGNYRETDITSVDYLSNLTYKNLKSKVEQKESFILIIYGDSSCGCWTSFKPILIKYYNDTHADVCIISHNLFEEGANKFGLYTTGYDMPSIALFSRGKLVIQTVYGRDSKDPFTKYDKFLDFMNSHVVLPKMFYINKTTLDSFIDRDETFNLLLVREGCGDCKDLRTNLLYNWNDKHESSSYEMYIFDIQRYRGTEEYQTIKDIYGLSTLYNPVLGWDKSDDEKGMVPTFQNRTGSTINAMLTVYNDSLDIETNKMVSYFTEERVNANHFLKNDTTLETKVLNGLEFTSYSKDTYLRKYVDPIINLFLKKFVE